MTGDNYTRFYADKLWALLPAVYRAEDTDQYGANGPLRELVGRIGATAATLRRSVDRLWEDQSIETCDDWVIPYIAELLDTRLVLGLDARGQRLDVANTIDYRRRKGTLGVIEQIASDITGWDAKVVEFFRRLGRTRHGLDPKLAAPASPGSDTATLLRSEGLMGGLTGTPIGGFADLRNVYGAGLSRTAFDEFSHTADTRLGRGLFGWQAIPHLGVFVWRLLSLKVGPVTPVAVRSCPDWFTFDPTGRDVPIFAPARTAASFGAAWVSPSQGQLPGPISRPLLMADIASGAAGLGLYPNALSVLEVQSVSPPELALLAATAPLLRPERGRFRMRTSPPMPMLATYCYGFPSLIGAGPFDRRGQAVSVATPPPGLERHGGGALAPPGSGTLTLVDSLTYDGAGDFDVTAALTLRAGNLQRPLVRLDPHRPWIITGTSAASSLVLDGLFVSGQDIVLRGTFASVTLACSTLDPGSAAPLTEDATSPPAPTFLESADGRALRPTALRIEAAVEVLTIDRSVLGPVRTSGDGTVQMASVSNSVVQGIRTAGLAPFERAQVPDLARLTRTLQLGLDPVSAHLLALDPGLRALLGPVTSPPLAAPALPATVYPMLITRLNALLHNAALYQQAAFAEVALSAWTRRLLAGPASLARNRLLLEDAFPLELADAALAFGDGTLSLSRCTALGRVIAHRFDASECILNELAVVDDLQGGCVRFSAWASGSVLPRKYESVATAQAAPLFTSIAFGQPGYAQLLPTADLQRIADVVPGGPPQNTISAGAADGSEMGAYARDKNPIRAQALLLKLQEYMPAGLAPVVVDVT